ncbi:NADP-dependent oxidoreductase [Pseudokineococcus sp. 1T1Z-3]|uniref:NADP-dependent oxidoreductase n=1 Tax=Pseudokineococcus sp. 1T1Z-3 TaxID=3132745 RepID=UPI00309AA55D
MRALVFSRYGGPEVLAVEEVADLRPPRGTELLVAVAASSVNGTDLGLRRGGGRVVTAGRLPFVPGFDVAGEVLACGPAVSAFSPGDRVVALLGHGGGGQAERVLVEQHRAALAPRSQPLEVAAALPLAGLTALQALRRHAGLATRPPGARVLVLGASGGIGAYAVQLARRHGAEVTALASAAKREYVAGLGAQRTLDRRTTALGDLARAGERFDVVLDAHGGTPWADQRALLAAGGTAVTTRGISPDALVGSLARRLPTPGAPGGRDRLVAVRTAARSYDLAALAAMVDADELRVPVEATYPLEQGAAAHRHVEVDGRGKTVLVV